MYKHINSDVKAVLFDHDDTLVGTIEACWALDRYVAQKYYNKKLTDDELRRHWSKPLRAMLKIIFETEDPDLAMERVLSCYPDYPKRLFDGTLPTIQTLHGLGKYTGIVSSTARTSFESDIDSIGLPRELLDFTQTQEDTSYHKPDARVFEPAKKWLHGMGIEDTEVLYVGDGLHDAQAAQEAGFQFIGVETGLVTKEQFAAANVISISDISKLLDGAESR